MYQYSISINAKTNLEEINKIEQFLHECMSWERLLDFFKQENSYLKTRLSKVLDHKTDKNFIPLAEHFQNEFILKDEFIDEMETDTRLQYKSLTELSSKKIIPHQKIEKKQQKLRNEMELLEKKFILLKNEFNQYLSADKGEW